MKITVSYSLDAQLVEKIKQAAEGERRSVSNYVENIIIKHFEKKLKEDSHKWEKTSGIIG